MFSLRRTSSLPWRLGALTLRGFLLRSGYMGLLVAPGAARASPKAASRHVWETQGNPAWLSGWAEAGPCPEDRGELMAVSGVAPVSPSLTGP